MRFGRNDVEGTMQMIKRTVGVATLACGVLVASACGSDAEPEAVTSSAQPQATAQAQPSEVDRSVSGEIAFVSDGVAQVQDGETQTAVRFTDTTTFTQQVELSLADVELGQCVFGMLAEDGSATFLTVTDADEDGTCSAGGFGGMGGGFGDLPSDGQLPPGASGDGTMPSGAPQDGTMPSGAPQDGTMATAAPDGMPGGMQGGFGSIVAGTVTAISEAALTVTSDDGTVTEIAIGADAGLTGMVAADSSAVEVGMCMTALGEPDSAGGFDATSISVSTPGDEGCISARFGGQGGGMPGQGAGQGQGPSGQGGAGFDQPQATAEPSA